MPTMHQVSLLTRRHPMSAPGRLLVIGTVPVRQGELVYSLPYTTRTNRTVFSLYQNNHPAAKATSRVLAGSGDENGQEEKSDEEALRTLMSRAWDMMNAPTSPEKADDIISELCRDVDAWVQLGENNGRVTMDLLRRIERGEFFYPETKGSNTLIIDELVDRVGERLTSHYVGYDVGSLDQTSLPVNTSQLKAMPNGSLVPSKTVDLELLEEQARALEATIGVRKAQSIVQLLGRKALSLEEMNRIQNIPEKTDAERVLEALMYIDDREERRELMQEAFIPVSADDGVDTTEEQEAISTTPMALYQHILSWQRKLSMKGNDDILPVQGISYQKMQQILEELRTDVFDSLQSQ